MIEMGCNNTECGGAFKCEVEATECPYCGCKDVEVLGDVDMSEFGIQPFNVGNATYGKSLISDSLAINPSQIAEHREKFPNVEVLPDGRLKFDDFKTHNDYLEKTGFTKRKALFTKRRTRHGIGRRISTVSPVKGYRRENSEERGND